MKWITLLAIVTVFGANCQTTKNKATLSTCIQTFIDSNKTTWQVGSVEEYEFQGKLVYAFTPSKNIMDGTTLIKSASCVDLCSVGGFAGLKNSNCNGDNFFEKAIFKRKIWEADK